MPAKNTKNIFITIRPRGGINDVEVGIYNGWVGANRTQLEKYAVVLEKPGTDAQHLHSMLVWKEETNQDNIKRQLWTLFAHQIETDTRWENRKVAVDCKAHHDPDGCVGGYLEKDEDTQILHCEGFDREGLLAGKLRRDTAIDKKKKKLCTKLELLPMLRDMNQELEYNKDPDIREAYEELSIDKRVDTCLSKIIVNGYINFLHIWSPSLRGNTIKYWTEILQSTEST